MRWLAAAWVKPSAFAVPRGVAQLGGLREGSQMLELNVLGIHDGTAIRDHRLLGEVLL